MQFRCFLTLVPSMPWDVRVEFSLVDKLTLHNPINVRKKNSWTCFWSHPSPKVLPLSLEIVYFSTETFWKLLSCSCGPSSLSHQQWSFARNTGQLERNWWFIDKVCSASSQDWIWWEESKNRSSTTSYLDMPERWSKIWYQPNFYGSICM